MPPLEPYFPCQGRSLEARTRVFALLVESDIAKRYFKCVAKRTTNLASTNKTQVRAFKFPVPSLSEQQQIAEIMKHAKQVVSAFDAKQKLLGMLKKSLMYDFLTGRVRVREVAGVVEAMAG